MRTLIIAGIAIMIFAAPAHADEKFAQMDTDGDGTVTWEEFNAAYPNMKRPAFDAIDANNDGVLSHEEWDGFRMSHSKNMTMGGQMPMKPMPQGEGPGELPLIKPPK